MQNIDYLSLVRLNKLKNRKQDKIIKNNCRTKLRLINRGNKKKNKKLKIKKQKGKESSMLKPKFSQNNKKISKNHHISY